MHARLRLIQGIKMILATLGLLALGAALAQGPVEVVVVQGAGPRDLDPHVDETVPVQDIYRHIFEALVYLDAEGQVQPWLAESWERIDDTTMRFHLRQGVSFHDGSPFTAETVRFNVERIWDPEVASTKTVRLALLTEARVVDTYTVDLITSDRFPLLLTYLPALNLVSEAYVGSNDLNTVRQNPVGTGLFRFSAWAPDQFIELERFEGYWGEPAKVDRLTFRIVPEASTRMAALLSGQADLVANIPPLLAGQVSSTPGLSVLEGPMGLGMVIHLNSMAEGPMQDVRVRQAMNHAIDMEAIIAGVLSGYAQPLAGQLADPSTFGYNPELSAFPYDPELARSLLTEAGYADGFRLTFHTPQGRYPNDRETAEAVAGMWREVGIQAEVVTSEWGTFLEDLKGKEQAEGAWLIGWYWTPAYDASASNAWFVSDGVYNIWDTPEEFDGLLAAAATSIDQAEREQLLQRALQLMHDGAAGVFLHQPTKLYGVSDRLRGWTPRPDDAIFLHGVEKQ